MSILLFSILIGNLSRAATLDTISIETDKQIVNPGTEVTLNINFGKPLGSYTIDINYDNDLIEYVTTDGGTANNSTGNVRIVYFDSTGGTNPKENMTVTFRAKAGLQTSNPTDLSITLEGMANADASESYDDIMVPIKKNIVVEPPYENYRFEFTYSSNPIKDEEQEMQLVLASNIGRFYDHARIIAEAITPDNGNVTLVGTDEQGLEHDIIDNGWGDASGYMIGGVVNKVLNLRGTFNTVGQYTITFKLIDRDNSDQVIASNSFVVNVEEKATVTPPQENVQPETQEPTEEIENNEQVAESTNNENLPTELPRTGYNYYILVGIIIISILIAILYLKRKQK